MLPEPTRVVRIAGFRRLEVGEPDAERGAMALGQRENPILLGM